jgi:hypothetical protein
MARQSPPGTDVKRLMKSGYPEETARGIVAVVDAIGLQTSRLGFSAGRVNRLIKAAETMHADDDKTADDLLRAAVVLLHASLEDYLRAVAAAYLRFAPATVINDVPLLGVSRDRPEKFLLGALVEHQNLGVGELIALSVERHLERSTFSSSREIAALLGHLDVQLDNVRPFFGSLDALAARRHLIVHRCDFRGNSPSPHEFDLLPIEPAEVSQWAETVSNFGRLVTRQLAIKHLKRYVPTLETESAASE